MLTINLKRLFAVAILSSFATFAFADDAAPVYDADNFPPQFDGQPDSGTAQVHPAPAQSYSANSAPDYQSDAAPAQNAVAPSQPVAPIQPLTSEQRLTQIEQKVTNLQHSNTSAKMDAMTREVQSLRGQVEQLTHQLQQIQNQQRSQFADLDKRITKQQSVSTNSKSKSMTQVDSTDGNVPSVANDSNNAVKSSPDDVIPSPAMRSSKNNKTSALKAAVASSTAQKTSAQQPNVAEEQQIYQTAYNLIKAKKYNEAVAALQKMLQKYPSGQFAANAHYWLGELYGLMGNNEQSAKEFGTVVEKYTDSPKVSDAQLKLGLIYSAQFKWPDAKLAFKKVINRYPGTASARLASEQLKQIKEAGH